MRLASYHIHTTFCDGLDTPERMVKAAIKAKVQELGFSAHSAWPLTTEWHLSTTRFAEYIDTVRSLQEKHKKRIRILCGFEADYIPGVTAPDSSIYKQFSPDYLIGSIHMLLSPSRKTSFGLWSVDGAVEDVAHGLAQVFRGNGKRAVQLYWHTVREMVSSCDFDIVGHLDLIRKRNGVLHFFDENEGWYKRELAETVRTIARSGKIVELNTGGMARKAIDGLYPSDTLLSLLYKRNVPVTLSSDAHCADDLVFGYDSALAAARRAGYQEIHFLGRDGIEAVKIDTVGSSS
ncbi:MAG TPA: histidinol-phosphatase [Treponema sp.]|nr:histidinol-phosphatase [Treponema sp.]